MKLRPEETARNGWSWESKVLETSLSTTCGTSWAARVLPHKQLSSGPIPNVAASLSGEQESLRHWVRKPMLERQEFTKTIHRRSWLRPSVVISSTLYEQTDSKSLESGGQNSGQPGLDGNGHAFCTGIVCFENRDLVNTSLLDYSILALVQSRSLPPEGVHAPCDPIHLQRRSSTNVASSKCRQRKRSHDGMGLSLQRERTPPFYMDPGPVGQESQRRMFPRVTLLVFADIRRPPRSRKALHTKTRLPLQTDAPSLPQAFCHPSPLDAKPRCSQSAKPVQRH
ncbi:hypothetical protein Landi51_08932 [Colletotrichum acutatum]